MRINLRPILEALIGILIAFLVLMFLIGCAPVKHYPTTRINTHSSYNFRTEEYKQAYEMITLTDTSIAFNEAKPIEVKFMGCTSTSCTWHGTTLAVEYHYRKSQLHTYTIERTSERVYNRPLIVFNEYE